MLREIIENLDLSEAKANPFIGKIDKLNYAVKIDGVTLSSSSNFGDMVRINKALKEFKQDAKTTRIGAKGKATLASVKAWIKENQPSQYYAKWQPDSSFYKDDSVEIYYKN